MARVCQVTGKSPCRATMFHTQTIKPSVVSCQIYSLVGFGLKAKTVGFACVFQLTLFVPLTKMVLTLCSQKCALTVTLLKRGPSWQKVHAKKSSLSQLLAQAIFTQPLKTSVQHLTRCWSKSTTLLHANTSTTKKQNLSNGLGQCSGGGSPT